MSGQESNGTKSWTRDDSDTLREEPGHADVWDSLVQSLRGEERFQRLGVLGAGGMGEVVELFDQNLHRSVARKELRDPSAKRTEQALQMLNEARLVGYLDHPGIVTIYDLTVEPDGNIHYTMRMLEGEPLSKRLDDLFEKRERMPFSQAFQILTKLCETLVYAHDKGVLHLDIKPENIILGAYGEVFLIDWGAALIYDPTRYVAYLASKGQGERGEVLQDPFTHNVGTIPFMPLEQITRPRSALTPAADIFSTGVLLYYMLTGDYPYGSIGQPLPMYAVELQQATPAPLDLRRGDLPPRLVQMCASMLQKDPQKRHGSVREILDELQDLSDAGKSFGTHTFQAGDVIFREGEEGQIAYHILEGLVEISVTADGQKRILTNRKSGDIIGELAVLTGGIRNATVIALQDTVVRRLTQDLIEAELEKLNPWISQMIRNLSHKYIQLHQERLKTTPQAPSSS